MVHVYSSGALALRRQRALERRYIRKGAVKQSDKANTPGEIQSADVLWSSDPWAGTQSLDAVSRQVTPDPIWCSDPWSRRDGAAFAVPSSQPLRCEFVQQNAWQNYSPSRSTLRDYDFASALRGGESLVESSQTWGRLYEIKQMQQLIDAQNTTIALLVHELEFLRSADAPAAATSASFNQCTSVIGRLEKLEDDVSRLAGSLSGAIKFSLDQRSEKIQESVVQDVEKMFFQMLKPHVDELIVPMLESGQSATVAHMQSLGAKMSDSLSVSVVQNVTQAFKSYDGYMHNCINEALERMETRVMSKFVACSFVAAAPCSGKAQDRDGIAISFQHDHISRIAKSSLRVFDDAIVRSAAIRQTLPLDSRNHVESGEVCIDSTIVAATSCERHDFTISAAMSCEQQDDIAVDESICGPSLPEPGASKRSSEMPMSVFLEVAATIRKRLPHHIEQAPALLMLCDDPHKYETESIVSDATSELPSGDDHDCRKLFAQVNTRTNSSLRERATV